jgi:hypothetical protein
MKLRSGRPAFIALMLGLFAGSAWGQSPAAVDVPAAAFAEIASGANVRSGATLIVTDQSGRRVAGRLTAISSDALSILTRDQRALTFRDQEVREVRRRVPDSKWEGALIGFAAGWLVPAAVCASRSDSSETLGCVLDTFLLGGLPGLGIGAAIDAAQGRAVIVFRARP